MSSAAAKKAAKKKAQRKADAAETGATLAVDASATSSSSTPVPATVLTAAGLKEQGSKAFLEKKYPAVSLDENQLIVRWHLFDRWTTLCNCFLMIIHVILYLCIPFVLSFSFYIVSYIGY